MRTPAQGSAPARIGAHPGRRALRGRIRRPDDRRRRPSGDRDARGAAGRPAAPVRQRAGALGSGQGGRRGRHVRLRAGHRPAAVGRAAAADVRLRPGHVRPVAGRLHRPRAPRRRALARRCAAGQRRHHGRVRRRVPHRAARRGDPLDPRARPPPPRPRRAHRPPDRRGVRHHRRAGGLHAGHPGAGGDARRLLLPRPGVAVHPRQRRGRAAARPQPRRAAGRGPLGGVPRHDREHLRGELPQGGRDRGAGRLRRLLPRPAGRLVRAARLADPRRPVGLLPRGDRAPPGAGAGRALHPPAGDPRPGQRRAGRHAGHRRRHRPAAPARRPGAGGLLRHDRHRRRRCRRGTSAAGTSTRARAPCWSATARSGWTRCR